MNITTVGDLMRITETELLSYKNFGETSLKEIKIILAGKGLRLGMAVEESRQESAEPTSEIVPENQSILSKPVDDLQLSVRARKCLQKLNIRSIAELTRKSEPELLGIKNFGATSLNEIKKVLSNYGLSLRTID
jgi:DNA-directed RNA polymerase subunit alpha